MTRRRGFTLIEVLTVIAIIIILVGIVVFGLGKVMGGTREKATQNTLENLRSMLSEYEVVSKGLKRQPARQWFSDGTFTTPPTIWTDGRGDGNTPPEPDPAPAPRDVTREAGLERYSADQVANTQLVIGLMQQAPTVRGMIEQLPSTQLMEEVPAGLMLPKGGVKLQVRRADGTVGDYNGSAGRPEPPLILDGWGNPIIFVPSGGLADIGGSMYVGGKAGDPDAKQVVPLDPATPPPPNQVPQIRSPDNRPFWASAGPDGNFLTGDDNVYSFEN